MSLLPMGPPVLLLLLAYPLNGGHIASSDSGNTSTSVCVCVHVCDRLLVYPLSLSQSTQQLHILINGPFDTPYEGGFFHFILRFPPDYPHQPPRLRFVTTGEGRVRFNPNLYQNGKVCLSILG